jgi:Ser/Thr protein kinase RdoA (MazF antagonist)
MRPYNTLTEHGQARRLRRLAFQALERYDLEVSRLSLVTNDLNGIFRLDVEGGEKFILRITVPEGGHTLDHVAAEMDWLTALARDTRLSVPRPIPARDGSRVVEASAPGVPEPRFCAIFTWVPGTNLAKHISPRNLSHLGELMASLHAHALTYQPPAGLDLLRFDRLFPFRDPIVLFEPRYADLITPERRAIFQQALDWAQGSLDRLKASGEPMRILHGDLHQWNVRYFRGLLSPIDFEDLMWGWPVQDIATSLYYFIDSEAYPTLRQAFQDGYSRHSPWPEQHAGEIDAFISARALDMVNFVLNDPNPKWSAQAEAFTGRIERRLRGLISAQASA